MTGKLKERAGPANGPYHHQHSSRSEAEEYLEPCELVCAPFVSAFFFLHCEFKAH